MREKDSLLLVLITAPDIDTAQKLARALVDRKIAACVNLSPGLVSYYVWEEELQEDQEVLLMVKTREGLLEDQLIPLVGEMHPYDLPEIIATPATQGLPEYLQWVCRCTEKHN